MTITQLTSLDAKMTSELLPFDGLISALRDAFAEGCEVPVRHHHTIANDGEPDATVLLMPAWHSAARISRYLGVKIVTVFPGNASRGMPGLTSTYMLYDGRTGRQLATLDGGTITARRTVAASALAADLLARKDSRRLLVVGAGKVGSLIPDAFCAVRPIEHIDVWDIDAANSKRLVDDLHGRGMNANVVDKLQASVEAADIVSAATLSTTPILKGAWLQPGTHVDLIGSFTPKMREVDDEAVMRSTLFADTAEALHESGDLVQPIQSGVCTEASVRATLAEMCRQSHSLRTSAGQITLYKAVGTALADLAAATMAYERLLAVG